MAKLLALLVIVLLCLFAVVFVVFLGTLPARIARRRQHPQVDAINAMSWLGLLLTGGLGWALALVWALIRYDSGRLTAGNAGTAEDVWTKTSELESRIAKLEQPRATSSDGESKA